MKLLFDENLSPALVRILDSEFPGSAHVEVLVGRGARDEHIWATAATGGFTIVTKDDDFRGLSFVHGAPPKVIWLSVGNANTQQIVQLLRSSVQTIRAFCEEYDGATILLLPLN